MPKFLIKANYTPAGLKGLQQDKASGREKAIAAALRSLDGKLEAFYYALGETDAYVLVDLPHAAAAAAIGVAVSASGMATTRTVPLLTVAEMDKALEAGPKYRPPGG